MAVNERIKHLRTTLNMSQANFAQAIYISNGYIAELESANTVSGSFVPWHLSAYHPDYKWKAPSTDPDFLIALVKEARKKIKFVYSGNISTEKDLAFNNTLCQDCGKTLINRRGYRVDTGGLNPGPDENGRRAYSCGNCGKPAPVRWN